MRHVILLAHGSPDPRAQDAAIALARSVEANLVDSRVHTAFLQHGRPLAEVCQHLHALDVTTAVVVPAFVTPAFHVRVDVPAAVATAHELTGIALIVTEPIGADASIIDAIDEALPPGPVVLAIAGTRDPDAQAVLNDVATQWSARRGHQVTVAHASQGTPLIADALDESSDASVAAFVLFPGMLPDRIAEAASGRYVTAPLSTLPATIHAVLARVRAQEPRVA